MAELKIVSVNVYREHDAAVLKTMEEILATLSGNMRISIPKFGIDPKAYFSFFKKELKIKNMKLLSKQDNGNKLVAVEIGDSWRILNQVNRLPLKGFNYFLDEATYPSLEACQSKLSGK